MTDSAQLQAEKSVLMIEVSLYRQDQVYFGFKTIISIKSE